MDLKATFENLQAALSSPDYVDGIDQATVVVMIGSLYKYVIGKSSSAIHLPAPTYYPDDKHRVMWPEGVKVKTRRSSMSSTGSGHYVRRKSNYALDPHVTTPRAMSRASSVTSTSQYSSRYIGIVQEEDDEPLPKHKMMQRQRIQQGAHPQEDNLQEMPLRLRREAVRSTGTNRVNGGPMKPTPSIERFMKNYPNEPQEERDEPAQASRPPRRPAARKSRFADDEE